MVVNHSQPEEPADPSPVVRRVELRYAERHLHAVAQMSDPVDCGPSLPGGCSSIFLMCGAQLGHCSRRARWSQALCTGMPTVNSRWIKVTMCQGAPGYPQGTT